MLEEVVAPCASTTCIPFEGIEHRHVDIKIKPKEGFDFSASLEKVYPLVSIICSYLPCCDLRNVAQLSETWKIYVEEEIKKRSFLSWLQLAKHENKCSSLIRSPKHNLARPGMGIALINYEKVSLGKYVCVHKPAIKLERKSPTTALYSWFHIPEIPNIRLLPFYFNSNTTPKQLLNLREYERIDTLLIFSTTMPRKQLRNLAELIQTRQQLNISVGGGVVWGIKTKSSIQRLIKRTDLFCIAFIRDIRLEDDFFSASYIHREGNNFEKSILKFKEKLQFREHSVLFRFCCCEKIDGKEEDGILRKHFPSVLLMQMDVNGEYGCNHIPSDTNDTGEAMRIFNEMQKMNGYTSTIVFITWGKRKK